MAIGIVSLIADGRVRLKVYCGSAACLSRAVDKSYLSVKQSSFQWLKLKNSFFLFFFIFSHFIQVFQLVHTYLQQIPINSITKS